MIALLDTHAFLRAAIEPAKLSARARKAIAEPSNEFHLSTCRSVRTNLAGLPRPSTKARILVVSPPRERLIA